MLLSRTSLSALLGMTLMLGLGAPASVQAQRSHTVRAGQSMSRIARRYHVNVWDLALANRMRPSATLRPGQELTVPPRGVIYVRPGQTLSHIARAHDSTVAELRRLNRLRGGLRAGQRLVLPGYEAATPRAPRSWGAPETPGLARIRRREDPVQIQLLDSERRVTRAGAQRLAQLMRRHDDDAAAMPNPRLVALLAAISDHFGGRQITLVSGRRPAVGRTRETSRHVSGSATDIRVAGVPRRQLWDYCRTLAHTGCGYYPRSTFVHVDVRDQAAQWVDWSRPGRRARYGNLARTWPRFCRNPRRRRHRACRRESRRVTAPGDVPAEVQLTEEAQALYPAEGAPTDAEHPDVDEYETASDDEEDEAGEPLDS